MRTRLKEEETEVYQYFDKFTFEDVEIIDMSNMQQEEIKKTISNLATKNIFGYETKLYEFKIFKYSSNSGSIFMRIHHIISDAWSCSKIGTQLISYLIVKTESFSPR